LLQARFDCACSLTESASYRLRLLTPHKNGEILNNYKHPISSTIPYLHVTIQLLFTISGFIFTVGDVGSLHLTVPFMNRLNQSEPAKFSILQFWTFLEDSYFLYFGIIFERRMKF
jgi:hypothetical protein